MSQQIYSPAELKQLFETTPYVIIDFYADWCPPCRAIAPVFSTLALKHSKEGKLAFAKVNTDQARELVEEYGITAMPSFLFFKDGQQVDFNAKSIIRGADRQALVSVVEEMSRQAQGSD